MPMKSNYNIDDTCNLFKSLQRIFRPPLDVFDVLIYLKHYMLARQHEAVDITEETNCPEYKLTADPEEKQPMPVYDFDPAQMYYKELQVRLLRQLYLDVKYYSNGLIRVLHVGFMVQF